MEKIFVCGAKEVGALILGLWIIWYCIPFWEDFIDMKYRNKK